MAAKPYMPFYTSDYMSDTAHLTMAEHGAYMLMIIHYWNTEKPLPYDDKKLAQICKTTLRGFRQVKMTVTHLFSRVGDTLVHKRIEKELEEYRQKLDRKRLGGQKTSEKRWGKKDSLAISSPNSLAIAELHQNGSYSESESKTDKQEGIDNKQTNTTVGGKGRRSEIVGLLEKYFSEKEMTRLLTDANGQAMLSEWISGGVKDSAIVGVLDAAQATGRPLKPPKYYRGIVLGYDPEKPLGRKLTVAEYNEIEAKKALEAFYREKGIVREGI